MLKNVLSLRLLNIFRDRETLQQNDQICHPHFTGPCIFRHNGKTTFHHTVTAARRVASVVIDAPQSITCPDASKRYYSYPTLTMLYNSNY